ncbi:MAG: nitroreductase family protein [Lachnospiraceae bacterium]|nr:nitroreductase family protein [Lachnospiraceae bacterium]
MELLETILKRRSVRRYTEEEIPEEKLEKILLAGLMAPTSRNLKPCTFYLIKKREILVQLSKVKKMGGGMLADSNAAIVVCADSEKADTWIEDSSIALGYMHLMAAEQEVGSCWCQIHLRTAEDGAEAEERVRKILNVSDRERIVGILALGMPQEQPVPYKEAAADWAKVIRIE